jgi:hypothetical protein
VIRKTNSDTFQLDWKTGFAGRWADQEAVLEFKDGSEMRVSFRFLHGAITEMVYDSQHWNEARLGSTYAEMDEASFKANHFKIDLRAVQPSKYALMVTRNQLVQDYNASNPALFAKLKHYTDRSPDVVVLTEGWGGVPQCSFFAEMDAQVFSKNRETAFVWAPVYATNRLAERHGCFSNVTSHFSAAGIPNLRMLDLWDISKDLGNATASPTHIQVGGGPMNEAIRRFAKAWCGLVGAMHNQPLLMSDA